jgi:DNA-binding CsgD family transcriptional regulator
VVTIMGATAQELYDLGHRETFFYLQHAMGLASSIGLGLALNRPEAGVVVLDGDGSALMNLGGLATLGRYRPANLTHIIFDNGSLLLTSVCRVSDEGAVNAISSHRGIGERDFSPREVRLVEFFHEELRPLIGRQLVSASESNPVTLSVRLRQTLACLVQGDSEKQAAARLGISHPTVHQYVTALYRRFGVQSRGQLLAHVLKRTPRAEWTRALSVTPADRSSGSA